MTLEALAKARHITGVKQVGKAVERGKAACVFIAGDAERHITEPLRALCADRGVEVEETATMAELGKACGIAVGSAAAAALTENR